MMQAQKKRGFLLAGTPSSAWMVSDLFLNRHAQAVPFFASEEEKIKRIAKIKCAGAIHCISVL